MIQEGPYGLFALQKLYHRGIAACVGLVLVVASGVGECATVEDEASPIAGGIGGQPLLVAEGEEGDGKWNVGSGKRNV